jgi:hypothetical protein
MVEAILQVYKTMGAALTYQAERTITAAEQRQIFAKHANGPYRIHFQLCRSSDRMPVPSEQLAHGRVAAGLRQSRVLLLR